MKRTIGALMIAASAIAFSASANAYEFKPYVGLDYTYSDFIGLNTNAATVNVGTSYNKYFGTELFYQFSESDKIEDTEVSLRAYGLDLYGYLPLGCEQKFALLGTAGISNIDLKIKEPGEKRYTENGLGYRLGAGAQYTIDENLSVRALARYTFTDKVNSVDHIMEYTAGVRYSF